MELSGWSSVWLHVFLMSLSVSFLCLLPECVFQQISMARWSRDLSFLPECLSVLSLSAVSDYCSFGDLHTHWTLKGQFEEREVRLFAAELGCALGLYILSTLTILN